MSAAGSTPSAEPVQSVDRYASFMVQLARQASHSPNSSLVPQPSNSAPSRQTRIITWDELIATGTCIHFRQPKPPQSLPQQESKPEPVIDSIEQHDHQNLSTGTSFNSTQLLQRPKRRRSDSDAQSDDQVPPPAKYFKLTHENLALLQAQLGPPSIVPSLEQRRPQPGSVTRHRRLSGQPPRRAATEELQRPYPNHDTPDRRKMIERLSKGLAVRLASPTPKWNLTYEEGQQIGIEVWQRKEMEQMLEAGFSARVLRPKDEDRRNHFDRPRWYAIHYGHPNDKKTWEYTESPNGRLRRVQEAVYTI
ncbi:hypothetical protein N7G274_006757 [Stereocaulon virgatum]|uniref:Uncharacterized protein n=1 Tax=Stereocaulon virgatum TaxID=373712 RepID=A0ABR4A484_9LECA